MLASWFFRDFTTSRLQYSLYDPYLITLQLMVTKRLLPYPSNNFLKTFITARSFEQLISVINLAAPQNPWNPHLITVIILLPLQLNDSDSLKLSVNAHESLAATADHNLGSGGKISEISDRYYTPTYIRHCGNVRNELDSVRTRGKLRKILGSRQWHQLEALHK